MSLTFNPRELERESLYVEGDLPAADLDIDTKDEVIRVRQPLHYKLELQLLEDAVLARGELELELDCECVRCLKQFKLPFKLEHWACHLPLAGDDKVELIDDSVDLTPFIREDILLAFPQHPLCDSDCPGLAGTKIPVIRQTDEPVPGASPWAALDRLKLDNDKK